MISETALSVVIPTYQRPGWLRRAVASLGRQHPPPLEVIAVARSTDAATLGVIDSLQGSGLPFTVVRGVVATAGFMPPIFEGIRLAKGGIVAFLDDDGEAEQGWTKGILAHYLDPSVGAVGGRCINYEKEHPVPVPSTDRVGYISPTGRFVGNMWLTPLFSDPVEVDFLMGGCMSYRIDVARSLEADLVLNGDVAFGYEVDLGLQVRRRGYKIVFDPAVSIRHHSAPRATPGMRERGAGQIEAMAFNGMRVTLRRLAFPRRELAVLRLLLIGERSAPGLGPYVLARVARRMGFDLDATGPALRGRLRAAKSVILSY